MQQADDMIRSNPVERKFLDGDGAPAAFCWQISFPQATFRSPLLAALVNGWAIGQRQTPEGVVHHGHDLAVGAGVKAQGDVTDSQVDGAAIAFIDRERTA